jgi:N-methylhydantoinase B
MEFSLLTERRRHPPPGGAGGSAGASGRNLLVAGDGATRELASKATGRLRPGERLRIETPGGGGYGPREPFGR